MIGCSMAQRNMKRKFINDALTMEIWKRKPEKGLVF
ncbi:MAG: hypothetical protein ACJAW3_000293 [Lentimonas sp.]|jgi:hypothetical protein